MCILYVHALRVCVQLDIENAFSHGGHAPFVSVSHVVRATVGRHVFIAPIKSSDARLLNAAFEHESNWTGSPLYAPCMHVYIHTYQIYMSVLV